MDRRDKKKLANAAQTMFIRHRQRLRVCVILWSSCITLSTGPPNFPPSAQLGRPSLSHFPFA
jgi:hypothetical protein